MTLIVGLDVSLARTGIARITPDAGLGPKTFTTSVSAPPSEKGEPVERTWRRLDYLAQRTAEQVPDGTDLVVVEAPALHANNAGTLQLLGAWWLVLDRVLAETAKPCPVVPVNPSTLKVYATGDGSRRTGKPQVVDAVRAHYGDLFDVDHHDIADAIVLAAMGAHALQHPIGGPVPDARARALSSVRWPFPTPHIAPAAKTPAPVHRTHQKDEQVTTSTTATIRVSIAALQAAIDSVVVHSEKQKQGDEQSALSRVRLTAGKDELLISATDGRTSGLAAVTILADDRRERFSADDGPLTVDLFPKQARQIGDFLTPNKVEGELHGDAELVLGIDEVMISDVSGKYPGTSATVPTIEQEPTATLDGTEHLGYPDLVTILGKSMAAASGTYKPLVPEPGLLGRFEVAAKLYGVSAVYEPVGEAAARGWLVWIGTRFVGSLESRHGDDDSLRRRESHRRHHLRRLGLLSAEDLARDALGGSDDGDGFFTADDESED